MRQAQELLNISTRGQGHHNITQEIAAWLAREDATTGIVVIFVQHVSASLAVRENADRDDLHTFFRRLEGDDMPTDSRTVHYSTNLTIPVRGGRMALGARQGVHMLEQRETPHTRQVVLHYVGE